MKILFIHDSWTHLGGAETYLSNLRKLLQERGHETFLFSTSTEEASKNNDTFIFHLKKKNKILNHLEYYYRKPELSNALRKYINDIQPDVIHLQNVHHYANTILKTALDSGIPVVQTVHDIGLICPTGLCVRPNRALCEGGFGLKCLASGCLSKKIFLYETMPQLIRKRLLRRVSLFITMSRAFEQKLRENGIERIVCIKHFIDAKKFTPALHPGGNRILYTGMLTPVKGVDILLKAMPKVIEKIPEAELVIAGDGPERSKLEKMAVELGITDRVKFIGKIPYEKIHLEYQKASVLAVPSVGFEQFSLSGLEAMASGIPAVGSRIGGIPEWIEDCRTGLLSRPFDHEDLAEKLIKILSDRQLASDMGARAREEALKDYTPEKHAERMLELYATLKNQKRMP